MFITLMLASFFFLLKVVFLLTVFVVETMTMTMRHSDKVFSRGSTLPYGREWRGRDFFNRICKCFCFFQYMMFLQNVFFFFFHLHAKFNLALRT